MPDEDVEDITVLIERDGGRFRMLIESGAQDEDHLYMNRCDRYLPEQQPVAGDDSIELRGVLALDLEVLFLVDP